MNRWLLGKVILVSLSLTTVASATVNHTPLNFHGSGCVPQPGSEGLIGYSQFGIQNNSVSVAASVLCPLPLISSGKLGTYPDNNFVTCLPDANWSPIITVYDRNPTSDVVCTYYQLNADGNVYQSWSAQSSGSQVSPKNLEFTSVTNIWVYWQQVVICTIPPKSNGDLSHVTYLQFPECVYF